MSTLSEPQLAVIDQAASVLLQYPVGDQRAAQRIRLVREAVDALPGCAARRHLGGFLRHLAGVGSENLAQQYVEAFDFRRRTCLYLTYYTDGDTRRRGAALGRLKQRYRAAGLELSGRELPDFLPVVLEFSAATGQRDLLSEFRPALELLRHGLRESGSPYEPVVEAVCTTLPGPTPRDREAILALAASGPPREEVGLDPYPTAGRSRP